MTAEGGFSPSTVAPPLYEARHLGFSYKAAEGGAIEALRDFSFTLRNGEFLSVIGPSGCGKTSLLKLLTGLQRPVSGELLCRGKHFDKTPADIGMAFQDSLLLPWRNVIDNVLLPIEILKRPGAEYLPKARDLLATVGLIGFEEKDPWELSGGMRQRVSLCRALITNPSVLLLDEPFAALDAFTREDLWLVLQELHQKTRSTMVLITHQINEAVFLSDRVMVLSKRPGTVVHDQEIPLPKPRSRDMLYKPDFIELVEVLRRKIER